MRGCWHCGATFPPHVLVCPNDGLETMPIVPGVAAPMPQQPMPQAPWPQQPQWNPPYPQPIPQGYAQPASMPWAPQLPPPGGPTPPPWGQQPTPPTPGGRPLVPGPGAPDPFLGKMVGNFSLTRKLGAGGMGAVYEGAHPHVGNRVAVKVLSSGGDQAYVDRFFAEARALNQVAHPHIVRVLDLGQHPDGFYYCVMELLEGESLQDVLKRGKLPAGRALKFLVEIGLALGAAHAKGIVHRDLKPSNVMIVRGEGPDELMVKLVDFGIAKMATAPDGKATQTGVVIGTPAYMSPEQAAGRVNEIDPRSDLYSFGLVAYEMLTGKHPFENRSAGELIAAQIAEPPKPIPPALRLPDELSRAIMKLLEKKREARLSDAASVVAIFRRALEGASNVPGTALAPPRATRPGMAPVPPASTTPRPPPAGPWKPTWQGAGATPQPPPPPPTKPPARAAPTDESPRNQDRPATSPGLAPARPATSPPPPPMVVKRPTSSDTRWGLWIGIGVAVLVVAGAAFALLGRGPKQKALPDELPPALSALAPALSKTSPDTDGTVEAFATSEPLATCRSALDAFREAKVPGSVDDVEQTLTKRLRLYEAFGQCIEKRQRDATPKDEWAFAYAEGLAAHDFARILDDLPDVMRRRAERLEEPETHRKPFYAQQYRGIARDRFVRASLSAPESVRTNLQRFCREVGCDQ